MSHTKSSPRFSQSSCGVRALASALALGAAVLLVPDAALADANSCTQQHASAQRELKAGHLKAAAEQFTACGSDETCPNAIRSDCVDRLAELDKLIPTVIFSVTDARGADVSSVKVYSGETLLADGLDGRPVSLDPGKHQFRFVLASGEVLENDVIVRQGERGRHVGVSVAPAATSDVATPTTEDASRRAIEAPPAAPEPRGLPAGFWIASGVSVAALGSWATFALMGRSTHSDLADCSPACSEDRREDYDSMKQKYLIADISLGVAVASAAVATIIAVTHRGGSEAVPSAARSKPLRPRVSRVSVAPPRSGLGAALIVTGTTF